MKTISTLWLLGFIALTSCSAIQPVDNRTAATTTPAEEKKDDTPRVKKRIAVVNFFNKSRHGGDEMARHATRLVRDGLLSTNEFIVVPPEEIEGSNEFINDFGEVNLTLIFKKARARSISGVVTGTIEDLSIRESGEEIGLFRSRRFAVTATIKLHLYDATTEREVTTQITSADVTEEHTDFFQNRQVTSFDAERGKVAVGKAVAKVVPTLPIFARKIAWTGRIAKVEHHRYYINAGEMTGIRPGQLLKIFEQGQSIYDPDTNALLGVAPGRVKGLLRVIGHFGEDGSIATVHSGAGFKERDRVEIFTAVQN